MQCYYGVVSMSIFHVKRVILSPTFSKIWKPYVLVESLFLSTLLRESLIFQSTVLWLRPYLHWLSQMKEQDKKKTKHSQSMVLAYNMVRPWYKFLRGVHFKLQISMTFGYLHYFLLKEKYNHNIWASILYYFFVFPHFKLKNIMYKRLTFYFSVYSHLMHWHRRVANTLKRSRLLK